MKTEIVESSKQLIYEAKIGDGHITMPNLSGKSTVRYSSIYEDYMLYKHGIIGKDISCSDVKISNNSAGFNKRGVIYHFSSHVSEFIGSVWNCDIVDIINNLDYFGFLMYYFDDGPYHKRANTMHIYCNTFSEIEVDTLINKVYTLFPIKCPTKQVDRKKDGREYPYIYIPTTTTREIVKFYMDFVSNRPLLHCMLYKLGSPSQTIENK